MNAKFTPAISEEIFAAWLDGNVTPEQDSAISQMCATDPQLQEILDASDDVDQEYENLIEDGYPLPEEFEDDFELPYIEVAADEEENAVTMDDEILPYENEKDNDGNDDADLEEIEEYHVENDDVRDNDNINDNMEDSTCGLPQVNMDEDIYGEPEASADDVIEF